MYGESMSPESPRGSPLQRLPEFVGDYNTLLYTEKVGQSFRVNMVSSRNLDYILYSAFDSSKGKNRLYYKQEATNLEINILLKLNISQNSGGSSKFPGGLKLFIGLPKQPLLELSAPVF